MINTIIKKLVSDLSGIIKASQIYYPSWDIALEHLVLQNAIWLVLPGFFSGFLLGSLVLCLVLLVALFKKKSNPKRVDQKQKNPIKIKDQRYIIRQRDAKGRLRHIETVNQPPNERYLKQFGPGNYCILTSKPKISMWKNITISEAKAKKGETPKKEKNSNAHQRSPPAFEPKVAIKLKSPNQDKRPSIEHKKNTSRIKIKSRRIKGQRKMALPPPPDEENDNGVSNIQASEPEMIKQNKKLDIKNTDSNLHNRDLAIFPHKNKKEKINNPSCILCNDTSGKHRPCEFCGKLFCNELPRNCLDNHLCEKSMQCHFCYRRIKIELIEVNNYCHNFFCSQRCVDLCYRDHKEDSDCKDCPGFTKTESDGFEENEEGRYEEEGENMENSDCECTECGETIEASLEYCPKCGSELICDEEEMEESEIPKEDLECPDCGTTIDESMSFCPDCGTELVEEEDDESECDKCGANVNESDRFCPSCGIEFEEEENGNEEFCDGYCNNCKEDCQDRCEHDGKCKRCPDYENCPIHCTIAEDECEKWVCKGFSCEDRILEIDEEGDGSEDIEEDEFAEDMDQEDREGDEGREESDEE